MFKRIIAFTLSLTLVSATSPVESAANSQIEYIENIPVAVIDQHDLSSDNISKIIPLYNIDDTIVAYSIEGFDEFTVVDLNGMVVVQCGESNSPFYDLSERIYTNGPLSYYVKKDNIFASVVNNDDIVTADAFNHNIMVEKQAELAQEFAIYNEQYLASINGDKEKSLDEVIDDGNVEDITHINEIIAEVNENDEDAEDVVNSDEIAENVINIDVAIESDEVAEGVDDSDEIVGDVIKNDEVADSDEIVGDVIKNDEVADSDEIISDVIENDETAEDVVNNDKNIDDVIETDEVAEGVDDSDEIIDGIVENDEATVDNDEIIDKVEEYYTAELISDDCEDNVTESLENSSVLSSTSYTDTLLPYSPREYFYNPSGICMGTASATLLAYYYDHIDANIAAERHINSDGVGLTILLADTSYYYYTSGSAAERAAKSINWYISNHASSSLTATYTTSNYYNTIVSKIQSGKPLQAHFNDNQINHSVCVIGYRTYVSNPSNNGIICTYGWNSNYMNVYVNANYIYGLIYIN